MCVVTLVILVYLEISRLERTESPQKIFYITLEWRAGEASELFQAAFGVQTIGITQAFEWFFKFKSYVMSVQDA